MEFVPAWFLRSPHAQSIWGRLVRPRRLVVTRREVLHTPDGDELVVDHLDAASPHAHFILMHGLEGSTNSVYIQGTLSAIAQRGQSATAINFRSCARDPRKLSRMLPNRRPRFYHSGETEDFDFVVRTMKSRLPSRPLLAFGASLGGNAILKWLGEHPRQNLISAAAVLSVPYDLAAGAAHLEQGAGPFYVARFLRTLKKKVIRVVNEFPETRKILHVDRVMKSKSFREFDDWATAPLHGFADADDYYRRSSSLHFLPKITTPVLCISADDDPFLPREALDRAKAAASPSIEFLVTRGGGHVGFIAGRRPWKLMYWAEERAVDWLLEHGKR
jgi:predicted alpha/beta-fold hydrolase